MFCKGAVKCQTAGQTFLFLDLNWTLQSVFSLGFKAYSDKEQGML